MADNYTGFIFKYVMGGGQPMILTQTVADTSFVKGDFVNMESGQLDLAVTDDSALVGAVAETEADLTAGTSKIQVYASKNAVYSVYDANARVAGATLDLATGARGVAASSNIDLKVIADSSATERTLVIIADGESYLD